MISFGPGSHFLQEIFFESGEESPHEVTRTRLQKENPGEKPSMQRDYLAIAVTLTKNVSFGTIDDALSPLPNLPKSTHQYLPGKLNTQ